MLSEGAGAVFLLRPVAFFAGKGDSSTSSSFIGSGTTAAFGRLPLLIFVITTSSSMLSTFRRSSSSVSTSDTGVFALDRVVRLGGFFAAAVSVSDSSVTLPRARDPDRGVFRVRFDVAADASSPVVAGRVAGSAEVLRAMRRVPVVLVGSGGMALSLLLASSRGVEDCRFGVLERERDRPRAAGFNNWPASGGDSFSIGDAEASTAISTTVEASSEAEVEGGLEAALVLEGGFYGRVVSEVKDIYIYISRRILPSDWNTRPYQFPVEPELAFCWSVRRRSLAP